ncbi:chromosome segregation protein SMC [Bradyrhizobium nitroreducens]|uniref:Chromosome segregation protein SMC n=1 Tax=Bradyrhizobium nitroreducens TaxID=709803 RepID=A0A2M6UGZ7_9BRAD|nr:AAA family ATPase [Bradyrhizobium nitroreducens]PIT03892.1 chromosome segregation protein SMC [Bradyrhizobium nitroreducens]
MRIQSITVSGFRSFGPKPQQITLADDLTTVVGPNASGKTALLQTLAKMFGVSRSQRMLHRSDFHLPKDVAPDDRTTRDLFIDVVISLPELKDGSATAETVAPTFRHQQLEGPKTMPLCRLRLEGRWQDDSTAEGEVTQELFWVDHLKEKVEADDKHAVSPADRGLIQFYYTPASRDAATQIRATTGALAARLIKAIEWSKGTRKAVDDATKKLSDAFGGEAAIDAISKALSARWKELHDEETDTDPSLALVSKRFEEVVAHIQVMFQHGPAKIERGLDVLSDGQQSLFYFALAAAVFDLERDAVAAEVKGFRADELRIPALSIFGIEEPENHLSPYYLSRIVAQVRSIVGGNAAQALITSHSPSVLSRIEPKEVRYCRCDADTRASTLRGIDLPSDATEAAKFIRGALLAFPELYFARFAVLVEGDSERIVIPRLAQAAGLMLDPSFVAIVPIGGRHVQHFWKLLESLSIPYATLVDLDLGRKGGGFDRVRTAIAELIAVGTDEKELLKTSKGSTDLEKMKTWDSANWDSLKTWVSFLEGYDVFYSAPLDLDMEMLSAFPAAYEEIIPKGGGPSLTPDEAVDVVLGKSGKGIADYTAAEFAGYKDRMPAYRYHFLTRSKPATHLQALAQLDDAELKKSMPDVYRRLLAHIDKNLSRD